MIGYLQPHCASPADRLLMRSYMCGLCHHVGATYGFRYRALVGPDLVFLNILLDLLDSGPAALTRRACVLGPGVTSLPVRRSTFNTDLAAAFGVWMVTEKLADDWRDDGGLHRWLAWRAFRPGARVAADRLEAAGFPVAEVRHWLTEQARIEAGGEQDLTRAAAPTRAIAGLLFRHAGAAAGAAGAEAAQVVGQHVGGFLFWMDNLLDYGRDVASGGYNALARAWQAEPASAQPPEALPDAARDAALAAVRAEVSALDAHVDALPLRAHGGYVRRVLVTGFADKVQRFEALEPARQTRASLRTLRPPAPGLWVRLETLFTRQLAFADLRLRMMVTLLLTGIFPTAAWAERWWPADATAAELGLDPALSMGLGTGPLDAELAPPPPGAVDLGPCDLCVANCGWFDGEACCNTCCGDILGDGCASSCSSAASDTGG